MTDYDGYGYVRELEAEVERLRMALQRVGQALTNPLESAPRATIAAIAAIVADALGVPVVELGTTSAKSNDDAGG